MLCAAPQLVLEVFCLNAEGLLKTLCAQKLLAKVSVGCHLLLNVCREGAYLVLIGTWTPAAISKFSSIMARTASNAFFSVSMERSHAVYPFTNGNNNGSLWIKRRAPCEAHWH